MKKASKNSDTKNIIFLLFGLNLEEYKKKKLWTNYEIWNQYYFIWPKLYYLTFPNLVDGKKGSVKR